MRGWLQRRSIETSCHTTSELVFWSSHTTWHGRASGRQEGRQAAGVGNVCVC